MRIFDTLAPAIDLTITVGASTPVPSQPREKAGKRAGRRPAAYSHPSAIEARLRVQDQLLANPGLYQMMLQK